MAALALFLFSLFIPNIHPCLVIRYVEPPKCNCPYMALDYSNIKSQVSDHSFYSNVSTYPIKAPIVSIDDCYGSVYCEGDYSLVVFDTESATNFGEYAADGLCDRYTQTWLLDDGTSGGFRTFQRLYATCVDFIDYAPCKPNDTAPLLFAYSNDLDTDLINVMVFYYGRADNPIKFSSIANVRFDVQQEEQIEFHSNYKDWTKSMSLRLPDPSLKFPSAETGSDVLKVIENYLDKNPICGTKIFIMVKRYPNEVDIARIVQKLRRNRIYLHFCASTSPSGGSQKETLYNLAAQTNGYSLFDNDDDLFTGFDEARPFGKVYLVYSANRQVSKNGFLELPLLTAPIYKTYWLSITFQDTVPSFPYSRVTLGWHNMNDSRTYASSSTAFNSGLSYGGAEYGQYSISLYPGVHNMTLEYNYPDDKLRTLQIRFLTTSPIDYWMPFDD